MKAISIPRGDPDGLSCDAELLKILGNICTDVDDHTS